MECASIAGRLSIGHRPMCLIRQVARSRWPAPLLRLAPLVPSRGLYAELGVPVYCAPGGGPEGGGVHSTAGREAAPEGGRRPRTRSRPATASRPMATSTTTNGRRILLDVVVFDRVGGPGDGFGGALVVPLVVALGWLAPSAFQATTRT